MHYSLYDEMYRAEHRLADDLRRQRDVQAGELAAAWAGLRASGRRPLRAARGRLRSWANGVSRSPQVA
jgi:hypothetical protein